MIYHRLSCILFFRDILRCCCVLGRRWIPRCIPFIQIMSTYPSSTLPNFITGFISTASLEQKKCLQELLTSEIKSHTTGYDDSLLLPEVTEPPLQCEPHIDCEPSLLSEDSSSEQSVPEHISPSLSDFVEHIPELDISDELSSGLLEELTSLKLRSRGFNGKPAKVKTIWLSPSSVPYNYGNVINNPKPIRDFPNIVHLMELVNGHPGTSGDMTACLVSCMTSPRSCLNYHADNEELIAQDSDICTFSLGPSRSLDFIWATNSKGRKGIPPPPDFSIPAVNHSLNIMRPGCQQSLLHRVPPGTETGIRYSLSFRRIVPPDQTDSNETAVSNSLLQDTTSPASQRQIPPKKKITLLAGDSYFARLDEKKLGKGKEEVYNVAKGGRKISQVQQDLEAFVNNHPDVEVKTLFICVGTNDIRNCQQGINHLKPVLSNFMKSVKLLVPNAKIFLQSLLPIPANGNPKAELNVISMNNLMYNLCSRFKIFFIDVFRSFLNYHGNRNLHLFPAYDSIKKIWDIHPNKKGLGVLARHYIFLIHSKWFNPLGY